MSDGLISRQAAIDALNEKCLMPAWCKVLVKKMLTDLSSAEPKWIPITEQTLPRHNSVVVVCGNKGTWDYGTYRGHTPSNINLWEWKKKTLREVHWWMYKEDALPKPWKGESDAEIH